MRNLACAEALGDRRPGAGRGRLRAWRGALVARDGGDAETTVPEAGNQAPGQRRASFLARVIPPPPEPRDESAGKGVPRSVRELAGRLPLERKVAQLFLFGFEGQDLNGPIFRQFRRLDLGRHGDRARQLHRPPAAARCWPARPP